MSKIQTVLISFTLCVLLTSCASMIKTNDSLIDRSHFTANVTNTKFNNDGKVIEKTVTKYDQKNDVKEITKNEVKTNNMNVVFIISGIIFCIISGGIIFWKIRK